MTAHTEFFTKLHREIIPRLTKEAIKASRGNAGGEPPVAPEWELLGTALMARLAVRGLPVHSTRSYAVRACNPDDKTFGLPSE